jgi:hypothetical protein
MDAISSASQRRRPRGPARPPTIPGFISEAEQAKRLGESHQSRRRNRRAGRGPRYVRVGRWIMYRDGADTEYLQAREIDPEARAPVRRGRPRKVRS